MSAQVSPPREALKPESTKSKDPKKAEDKPIVATTKKTYAERRQMFLDIVAFTEKDLKLVFKRTIAVLEGVEFEKDPRSHKEILVEYMQDFAHLRVLRCIADKEEIEDQFHPSPNIRTLSTRNIKRRAMLTAEPILLAFVKAFRGIELPSRIQEHQKIFKEHHKYDKKTKTYTPKHTCKKAQELFCERFEKMQAVPSNRTLARAVFEGEDKLVALFA